MAHEAGPLASLTVVDLTTSYAGPTATMYLADLGAEVIKVERPGGDDARYWGPPFVDGVSAWFASANRNKKSVVLDLTTGFGQRALRRLLATADVFIENLNPAKLSRLGLDPETLRGEYPRLIYCAISGFGLDGPDSARPGYDLVAQARSGMMSVTGEQGRAPQRVSTALSDIVTGMSAALAISAAVVRQRTQGIGELIDVSLLDSDLALMAPRIASYLAGEPEPQPSGGTDSVLAVYQAYRTADRPLVIAIGNDQQWGKFCDAIGLPEVGRDPTLSDNAARRTCRADLTRKIEETLATRKAHEWKPILDDAAIPCSFVQSLSEVVADSQVQARDSIFALEGSDGLVGIRSPFRLASIPVAHRGGPPPLGAHTAPVLADLGYTGDDLPE